MNVLEVINVIIVGIGVPGIIVALIFIGRKLQILDDLQKTVDKLKVNLKVVSDHLINEAGFNPSELKSFSPLTLTQEGRELVSKLSFDTIFEQHIEDFFSFIESESPTHKHDVEVAAIKSIYALSDEEYMGPLKSYLYQNPSRTLANMAPTLGIYVRDKYLEAYQNLPD